MCCVEVIFHNWYQLLDIRILRCEWLKLWLYFLDLFLPWSFSKFNLHFNDFAAEILQVKFCSLHDWPISNCVPTNLTMMKRVRIKCDAGTFSMDEGQGREVNLFSSQISYVFFKSLCDISIKSWLVPRVDERNQWDLFWLYEFIDCFSEHCHSLFISYSLESAFRINEEHQRVHLIILNTHAGMFIEDLPIPCIL